MSDNTIDIQAIQEYLYKARAEYLALHNWESTAFGYYCKGCEMLSPRLPERHYR